MLPVFTQSLDAITTEDVQTLVKEEYPEGTTVEFKEKLPHRTGGEDPWYQGGSHISDYARNALVAEVIAFANAHGGTLLLGIAESEDRLARAVGITPVPRCADLAERLRLQIRDCVEPQIPIVTSRGIVTDAPGSGVVLLRIPKSRLAPHRHLQTRECYYRRADRTEKMTMRDIQDLTLQTARGMQAIDQRFAERRQEFLRWVPFPPATTPYGVRVTLVPLEPLYTERVFRNPALFPFHSRFVLTVGARKADLHVPTLPRDERPMLRGTCRIGTSGNAHYRIHQELTCDGVAEMRLTFVHPDNFPLNAAVVLGAVANGLHMADAFRQGVGAPDVEYALEMELVRLQKELDIGLLQGLSDFWFSAREMLGTIAVNPCLFPRLSVGSSEAFGALMRLVTNDLWNAAGAEGIEEAFRLEVP